ncbi:hypothetical protein L3Y34_019208 [Caenorhabditis briggsae]|nr:hypothetical protein L3Y34_019208 [Caenorhabditis briggsae]
MPISPLIAGQCNGILATYFKIWSHYLIAFIITAIIAQMECLVFCFAKKHQIIANLVSRHVLSNRWFISGIVVTFLVPIVIGLVFSQSAMRREDQLDYVREHHPAFLEKLSHLENFSIYSSNPLLIIVLSVTSIGGFLCGLMFLFITIDMLKMLKEVQTKVSAASFRRYKNAVNSLLAQFSTSSLLLAPLFLFVVLTAAQIENSDDAADIIVAMMAWHSPVNAIVLVVTTPPYRNYILRKSPHQSTARVNTFSGHHSHGSFSRLKNFFKFQ